MDVGATLDFWWYIWINKRKYLSALLTLFQIWTQGCKKNTKVASKKPYGYNDLLWSLLLSSQESIKILGVHFDFNMSWSAHPDMLIALSQEVIIGLCVSLQGY